MAHIDMACCLDVGVQLLMGCGASDAAPYHDLRTCTADDGTLDPEELLIFEGCERLDGSIVLRDKFSDRRNLASIVLITGNLNGGGYVGEPLSLEGLDSLEVVEGGFTFFTDNLIDYSGVPKLRSVGSFSTRSVPELEDFRGLENLSEVRGNFTITSNPKLQSLAGLEGLEPAHGDVRIRENPLLPQAEIDALCERVTVDGEVK